MGPSVLMLAAHSSDCVNERLILILEYRGYTWSSSKNNLSYISVFELFLNHLCGSVQGVTFSIWVTCSEGISMVIYYRVLIPSNQLGATVSSQLLVLTWTHTTKTGILVRMHTLRNWKRPNSEQICQDSNPWPLSLDSMQDWTITC